jgi:uncharacterized protein
MKRVFLFFAVLLVSSTLFAQAAGDTPATREDVLKLFDTMHIREQMQFVLDSVAKQQRTMVRESMKKRFPGITESELNHMDEYTSEILKEMPFDGMLDDMIPVYQKHLTKADIDAMSAFYASPTGQKMLREMPAMTTESMQAASPRIQAMMEKVMDRAEKMTREEHEKKSQPAKPDTVKN